MHSSAVAAHPPTPPPVPPQLGGMGFVHYNNTAEEQLAHVKKAKSHAPGFIVTPFVVGPSDPIARLDEQRGAKGFCSACVTDTGKLGGRCVVSGGASSLLR